MAGINNLMAETMEKIRSMVDVNTIVGDPITTPDGTTLIPVSKVTFGFGSGGSDFLSKNAKNDTPLCFGGGAGAGVSIIPIGFLVVNNGEAHMLPVNMPADNSTDRLIEMIPSAFSAINNMLNKRKEGKSEKTENTEDITTTEE